MTGVEDIQWLIDSLGEVIDKSAAARAAQDRAADGVLRSLAKQGVAALTRSEWKALLNASSLELAS